ncbi:MAG: hypothetical protein PVH37_18805 [Desulfobacterales bacterium]
MKILILQLMVIAQCLLGCAATHRYEIQSNRVTFYLKSPVARAVAFASSLDGYELHKAEKVGRTRWKVTVSANSEFSYFYLVDGAVHVPDCQFYEKDDFGSRNCIYVPD